VHGPSGAKESSMNQHVDITHVFWRNRPIEIVRTIRGTVRNTGRTPGKTDDAMTAP
jgi:hypothetical protein